MSDASTAAHGDLRDASAAGAKREGFYAATSSATRSGGMATPGKTNRVVDERSTGHRVQVGRVRGPAARLTARGRSCEHHLEGGQPVEARALTPALHYWTIRRE
jgi:hypothetical protein